MILSRVSRSRHVHAQLVYLCRYFAVSLRTLSVLCNLHDPSMPAPLHIRYDNALCPALAADLDACSIRPALVIYDLDLKPSPVIMHKSTGEN